MQVRNLLIAAGATLAGVTALASAPTAASAQEFYRHDFYRPPYDAPYRFERAREFHRMEVRRFWEHRRFEPYRFHHAWGPYRGW